jgi:hypothetical protein
MADPVRDLNNFLQGQPGGNATREFEWLLTKEGPEHGTIYHVTAVCKHCDNSSLLFLFTLVQQSGESTLGLDMALQRASRNVLHLCRLSNT